MLLDTLDNDLATGEDDQDKIAFFTSDKADWEIE